MNVTNLTISSGRVLSQIDLENNSKICLLGNDIAETLFSLSNPVGQSIKIDGDNYTVVGVLTKVGSSMGSNIDDMIMIPFTTAKYLGADTSINNLYIKVSDENKIDSTASNGKFTVTVEFENDGEVKIGMTAVVTVKQ